MSEEVFGRLNGEWKVGVGGEGRTIVHTGIIGVDGWQLVCRPNPVRDSSATDVAHMIAAAPDMFLALRGLLREAVEFMDSDSEWEGYETDAMREAREALAKAEGKVDA